MDDVIAKMRVDFDLVAKARCESGHWSREDAAMASQAIKAAISADDRELILCWARWLAFLSARDLAETSLMPPEPPSPRPCHSCAYFVQPNRTEGFCSGRKDLARAYGSGHPLHVLPDDGGLSCSRWKGVR